MSKRVFVTGATGYLGLAIARRMARAGHTVTGLTRDSAKSRTLESSGVTPLVGDLTDPESFIGPLKNADVVVHAAAADDGADAATLDQKALDAVRKAVIDGRVKRLLYTSGMWVHGASEGVVLDESSPIRPLPLVKWRAAHEEVALDFAEQGLETILLRPAIAYGHARGILGAWWKEAREAKTVTYPGDGSQHWGMVHVDDVAEAFVLALEHAAPGDAFALVDESRHTVKEMADAVASVTGAKARGWPLEDVLQTLGAYGEALLADQRITAARARRDLGWVPRHTSFVRDAEALWAEWQAGLETTVN